METNCDHGEMIWDKRFLKRKMISLTHQLFKSYPARCICATGVATYGVVEVESIALYNQSTYLD